MSPDKVSVTIDGVELSVDSGTLIIRAAEQSGVRIPRFCDHPLLKPVAACRQCLVEVGTPDKEGNIRMMPKPQPSCAITVSPGMVVKTQKSSEVAKKAQEGVMEFLLINHPLDCPICDKGGECPLQNQAMSDGRDSSRFTDVKRVYRKPMRLTTQIMLDRDRCILCQRCVRFGKEIAGDPFLDLQGRGGGTSPVEHHQFMGEQVGAFDAEVLGFSFPGADGPKVTDISGPYGQEGIISSHYTGHLKQSQMDLSGRSFASYFSGNVIQICPVGALTSTSYRFRSRPFDLVSVPSVTEHDASGSAMRVDIRRGEVVRRLAGNDPEVNEEWITDKDRFAFHWFSRERLTTPLIRKDGKLTEATWPEAIEAAAAGLREADGASVGLLPGGRLPFEDAWAWSKFARKALRTNNIDARWRYQSEEEAQFLGAFVAGKGLDVTYGDVEKAQHVLLVGLEPEDECGSLFLRLRKAKGQITAIANTLTVGMRKLGANVIVTRPGEEAAALQSLDVEAGTVVLVGERAARSAGLLSALAALDSKGARLQWVPRRSGDRAAVDAGLLPGLLPFGRPAHDAEAWESLGWGADAPDAGLDAQAIVSAATSGELKSLVTGGIDLRDWPNPEEALKALESVPFVVSLEVTKSDVTELADVVLPVAPAAEKNGTFINWEGRLRPFGQAYASRALTDRQVLTMVAGAMGISLGLNDLNAVYAEANPLMTWQGSRISAPSSSSAAPVSAGAAELSLVFHKPMIDRGLLMSGADHLQRSARRPVAFVSEETLRTLAVAEDDTVKITGPRGSVSLPIETTQMAPGVVWIPECSIEEGVHRMVGSYGSNVTVSSEGSR